MASIEPEQEKDVIGDNIVELVEDLEEVIGDELKEAISTSTKPGTEVAEEGDIEKLQPEVKPLPKRIPWTVWCILIINSVGVFMASVSTTALVIAFPTVLEDLNMSLSIMMWVLLVTMLMLATVVPTAGKLGDVVGQRRIYLLGYWAFVLGCLGGGFSNKDNEGYDLIAARVVSGFGAALLFTNSAAILTSEFAPYGKVGLSQGIFQLFSAMGSVFGPLIGGVFSETNWRWILWYNAPIGGILVILATFILQEKPNNNNVLSVPNKPTLTTWQHLSRFDFLGTISGVSGTTLLVIALMQVVVADPVLSKTNAVVGLVIAGCFCIAVFVVDQFYAIDPLIPPRIFNNRIFSLTVASTACMAFVRNSITYNMIFYLQGPFGQDPLAAGITLIPFGIGTMFAGFVAGALTDKIGARNMATIGPMFSLVAAACLSVMDENTSAAYIGGILFFGGMGSGLFQSPTSASQMLSVDAELRGVAAAVNMLVFSVAMMVGIVLTFYFVLHSMTATQLFGLFVYGAGSVPGLPLRAMLNALAKDYYIIMTCAILASVFSFFLPHDMHEILKKKHAPQNNNATATTTAMASGEMEKKEKKGEEEMKDEPLFVLASANDNDLESRVEMVTIK